MTVFFAKVITVLLLVILPQLKLAESIPIRHTDWMGDLMPVIGNHTLFDLTLPGTHDSLAHDLCPTVDPAQPAWLKWFASFKATPRFAETQSLGVSDQLDHGVRFLDLRIMLVDDVWHGVHFLTTCEPAIGYFYAIRNFLNRHPSEIVVLWLSEHGEPHLTGPDQFPGVSREAKTQFWGSILEVFEDLAIPGNQVKSPIGDLVARDKRVLFAISDYAEFTGNSELALDAGKFLNNDISRDLNLTLSLPLMEKSISQGAKHRESLAKNDRYWLMSLAPAVSDFTLIHGSLHSVYMKTRIFGDTYFARLCAEAIGVKDMTWCPDSLLEFSRLFNYYAQALVERAMLEDEEADLPHAFYVDAFAKGEIIQTDRRTRSNRGYALVDKILIRNVRRLCKETCAKTLDSLNTRADIVGPFRLWEDPKHGRVSGWPGLPV